MQSKIADKNLAARGMIEPGQEMDQRALAAAARSADRDKFVPRDFERNTVERVHRPARRSYIRG